MFSIDTKLLKKGLKEESLKIKSVKSYFIKENEVKYSEKLNLMEFEPKFISDLVKSIKCVLGQNKSKIFDLEIKDNEKINTLQNLNDELDENELDKFVEQNSSSICSSEGTMFYCVNFQVIVPISKPKEDALENDEKEEVLYKEFDHIIMFTIQGEDIQEIGFSLKDKKHIDFNLMKVSFLDYILKLDKPIDMIFYPTLIKCTPEFNKLTYYTHKANEINNSFVHECFGCEFTLTAKQEKLIFSTLLRKSYNKLDNKILYNIYNKINNKLSVDNELISASEISSIIENSNCDNKISIDDLFNDFINQKTLKSDFNFSKYKFNIQNLIPNFKTPSISIKNKDINLKVNAKTLNSLETKEFNGETYMLIKLEQDLTIEDLEVEAKNN